MNPIYNTAVRLLGMHLTLDPSVPRDVGCAEADSFVLKNAGYAASMPQKGIPNVLGIIAWALTHGEEIQEPEPGCIVTAHSPNPYDTTDAHTGIGLRHGIASNNSNTGIFSENYTYEGWNTSFKSKGSKTRYFRIHPPACA